MLIAQIKIRKVCYPKSINNEITEEIEKIMRIRTVPNKKQLSRRSRIYNPHTGDRNLFQIYNNPLIDIIIYI